MQGRKIAHAMRAAPFFSVLLSTLLLQSLETPLSVPLNMYRLYLTCAIDIVEDTWFTTRRLAATAVCSPWPQALAIASAHLL